MMPIPHRAGSAPPDPSTVRPGTRYARDLHLPRRQVDHEEHVVPDQAEHAQHLHREEVRCSHPAQVRLDERRPRVSAPTQRCGLDPPLPQDPLDRVPAHVVPDILQRASQPRVAPPRVPRRHFHEQPHDLGGCPGPSWSALRAPVVLLRHKLPIPPQDRIGRRDAGHLPERLPPDDLPDSRQPPPFGIGQADLAPQPLQLGAPWTTRRPAPARTASARPPGPASARSAPRRPLLRTANVK